MVKLLKLAKRTIPELFEWFYDDLELTITQSDVIIPHQASKLGLHMFSKLYPLDTGQIMGTLHTYGKCIAGSILLTLIDSIESGKLKRGDVCLLIGTSTGFSIGAALLRY